MKNGNSVNVLQPKTTRNTPILKDLVLALIAVQENTQHGEHWGIPGIQCKKGFIVVVGDWR